MVATNSVNGKVTGKAGMDKEAVRIGVIGAGRMGKNHCRVVSGLRRATLAGVCDQNVQMGVAVASQY